MSPSIAPPAAPAVMPWANRKHETYGVANSSFGDEGVTVFASGKEPVGARDGYPSLADALSAARELSQGPKAPGLGVFQQGNRAFLAPMALRFEPDPELPHSPETHPEPMFLDRGLGATMVERHRQGDLWGSIGNRSHELNSLVDGDVVVQLPKPLY